MDTNEYISFKVTPSQKETIDLRAAENGFDDASTYAKVVALKTQPFILTSVDASPQEKPIEIAFQVSKMQKVKIEENFKASAFDNLSSYLQYVTLHGVVTSVVEVRSTGTLDTMLKRITESRKPSKLTKLF